MMDGDIGLYRLFYEGEDVVCRDPRRAETGCDVGGPKICRLDTLQSLHVAGEGWIQVRRRTCGQQLRPDWTGQIGIGDLPGTVGRIAEDCLTQFVDDIIDITVQKLGDMIGIDMTAFVQNHRERIRCRGGHGRRRRRDDPFDRLGLGGVGLKIVVLDRGYQPAIGIVEERHQVRPAMDFPDLTGFRILRRRDGGDVDRTEFVHEARPGNPQRHLGLSPRLVAPEA